MENPPDSEVRTFLFADVRGYTRFCQEHGDETGARLASRFATLCRNTVAERSGQVIELRGDEALAVFSSVRQALRAAVDLQGIFADEIAEDPSLPLKVGIGLDSGEAVPVEGGYRGGALNLAARLCALAGPGEVLASEGVIHLARKMDGLQYVERGFAPLKGFAAAVRIIEVISDDSEAPALSQEETIAEVRLPIGGFLGALPASPLICRQVELEVVTSAIDAVAGGSGRLLMLAGEPGVGKTRLAQEVTLAVRDRGFLPAAGRCYEAHRTVPFYPFLEALAAVYAACPSQIRADAPRRWPHLGRILPDLEVSGSSTGADGQEEQQRLFRAITDFLQAIAAENPVALLIDDLHWADEASLELLQHLARHTRVDRVLLLGTYRDAEIGRQHPLEGALRDLMREELVERIAVHRLPLNGTAALIAASFGEEQISAEFAGLVHGRTEGNPFFVQHVLRVLLERGDVFRKAGKWDRRDISDIQVPDSVRSVIGQRLSQLSETTQEILREASVLGQTFEFDCLKAMGTRSEDEVEGALEEVQASGLIREAGREAYAFDHALTQQALYAELTSRRRRRLHLAAGLALEGFPSRVRDQRAGELAWHFLEGDDIERALPYTLRAAYQAEVVFANDDAEQQYTAALEIAEQLENRAREAEILASRGRLRLATFRGRQAAADYERLLSMARETGDQPREVEALLGLGRARYVIALDETDIGSATSCREQYEAAYELAQRLDDKPSMVRALLGSRWLVDFFPDYLEQTMANRREALAISQELGDEELILASQMTLWRSLGGSNGPALAAQIERQLRERRDLHALNEHFFALMWAHRAWGNLERAIEYCDAGIQLASELGIPPVQYNTLKALSFIDLGRYDEAWTALEAEIGGEGHPFGRAMQTLGASVYLLDLLAYDRALVSIRDAITQAIQVQRTWMRRWGQELLILALVRSGQLDMLQLEAATSDLRAMGFALPPLIRAEVAFDEGRLEEAHSYAEAALTADDQKTHVLDRVSLLIVQARIALRLGRLEDAIQLTESALGVARRTGALPLTWRIHAVRADIFDALGVDLAASEARESAEQIVRLLAANVPDPQLRAGFLSNALAMVITQAQRV